MCKRNLNANIIICDNVLNNTQQLHGVNNYVCFEKQPNRWVAKNFYAVVRLSVIFSEEDKGAVDNIQMDTEYDFALVYYDGQSDRCPVICQFTRAFNDAVDHRGSTSFSSHQIIVNILNGHISIDNPDATYVDLMLLVRPKGDEKAKWTRQTIERIQIQTS